jgi:hypothetical protein
VKGERLTKARPARSRSTAGDAARTDRIREILEDLIRQRQSLRSGDEAERGLLEANRRSIVYWQGELAQALVGEHVDPPDEKRTTLGSKGTCPGRQAALPARAQHRARA